jgi:type II secretory pathway pseudopilin PulG
LLETLVALVVAATAAAIILSFTRAQFQRVVKEREHTRAATQVLNNSVRLSLLDWRAWPLAPDKGYLTMEERTGAPEAVNPGSLEVRNFLLRSSDLIPPVEIAYTPLQQFTVGETSRRYSLSFVAAALPPPANPSLPMQLPANVQAALQAQPAKIPAAPNASATSPPPKENPVPTR